MCKKETEKKSLKITKQEFKQYYKQLSFIEKIQFHFERFNLKKKEFTQLCYYMNFSWNKTIFIQVNHKDYPNNIMKYIQNNEELKGKFIALDYNVWKFKRNIILFFYLCQKELERREKKREIFIDLTTWEFNDSGKELEIEFGSGLGDKFEVISLKEIIKKQLNDSNSKKEKFHVIGEKWSDDWLHQTITFENGKKFYLTKEEAYKYNDAYRDDIKMELPDKSKEIFEENENKK